MSYVPTNPLIVQSDRSLLLEVNSPLYNEARDCIARFAELEKSPEHIHTYRITPLSLWNAAASGLHAEAIIAGLARFSKFDLPASLQIEIKEHISRYGRIKLIRESHDYYLVSDDLPLLTEVANLKEIRPFLQDSMQINTADVSPLSSKDGLSGWLVHVKIHPSERGRIKQVLIHLGFPVEDLAGYVEGAALQLALREVTASGYPFALRDYQREAAEIFYAGGGSTGGSGVIVLPCGSGKTVVGLAAMAQAATATLILTTSVTAARQWIDEIIDKTFLPPDKVGEYTGERKQVRPVTVTTYQTLTYRPTQSDQFPHLRLFDSYDWGLIIYDEVHLLPAPVFRATADIQARRRLGLTATLVREDGLETDVFSLIGPKRYDVPWKDLEQAGWIAQAICHEVRVDMEQGERMLYATAPARQKFRIASESGAKLPVIRAILRRHREAHVLIIGQYVDQLESLAQVLDAPVITGKTSNLERRKLYDAFRLGEEPILVVSKVANFAIDLPEASVAIQVSGTFGSRQEEAQRLGRLLRPKQDDTTAHFYSIVSRDTNEQEFAGHRQLFLTEQGYRYWIHDAQELMDAYRPPDCPQGGDT
jgi:DNA excision repair protein ERCC-3